jgi:hypothetical protein
VGETGTTAGIKIWRSRRKEWNPEQKFQGDKAYVRELLIDTPQKKIEVKILQMLKKQPINRMLKKE